MQQKTIVVKCPRCGNERKILEVQAGRNVVCPACETEFLTAELDAEEVERRRNEAARATAATIRQDQRQQQREREERRRVEGGWASEPIESDTAERVMGYRMAAVILTLVAFGLVCNERVEAVVPGLFACAAWLRGGLYRIEHTLKYWQPGDGGGEHD
ncbi:MAG: hypothetical protein KAV00_12000 [Phycisphaerae bacterium]|nr:hypothetical protein [Phycisphaerae bacterium]